MTYEADSNIMEISLKKQIPRDNWDKTAAAIQLRFEQVLKAEVDKTGMMTITCDFGKLEGTTLVAAKGILHHRITDFAFEPLSV